MASAKKPKVTPAPAEEHVDPNTGEVTPTMEPNTAVMVHPPSGVIERALMATLMEEARNNPRSVTRFIHDATNLVTMNEKMASACIYSLPRGGKMIRGPSVRFAEILRSTYRHMRVTADILDIGDEYVTVRGVCIDLQNNSGEAPPVMRRIVDKYGKRYNSDMIQNSVNAAIAIARRNAILTTIPQAIWQPVFDAAVQVIAGDSTTLASRRDDAMKYLARLGVTPDLVFATLKVRGLEDIGLEELADLRGLATAIRDGETTVDKAFPKPQPTTGVEGLKAALSDEQKPEGDGKKTQPE